MSRHKYKKKTKRGESWTEEELKAALYDIQSGQLKQSAACRKYNIPKGTIRRHLEEGCFRKKHMGRKPIFSEEQEADFAARIIRYSTISVPLKPRFIRRQAFLYCEEYGMINNFSGTNKTAGADWLKYFLKRNPSIAEKVPRTLSPTQKVYKFIVMEHFRTIKNLIDQLGIPGHPERLYSMDVKGCRINLDSQKTIKKGSKKVQLVDTESNDDVIIAMCVNAIGTTIPPMILFKGKRLRNDMTTNLPPGTLVRVASKGNMSSDLLVEFIQHLGKFKIAGKCLLVFDGAKYELSMEVLDEADRNDIVLYCLPSKTSHELQPLDKSVKKAYDHHWDDAVTNFSHSTSDKKMKKDTFNKVFSQVWSKCTTPSIIVKGFEETGLFPFNPEAIQEGAYVPSTLSVSDEATGNLPDVSSGKGGYLEKNKSVKSLSEFSSTSEHVERDDEKTIKENIVGCVPSHSVLRINSSVECIITKNKSPDYDHPSLTRDQSNLFQRGVCQYAIERPYSPQETLNCETIDENSLKDTNCDDYGKYLSKQLQNVDKTQRMLFETLINDAIHMAKLGKLTPFHFVNCRSHGENGDLPVVAASCTDIKEEIDETVAPITEANSELAPLQSVPKKENGVVITAKGKRVSTIETKTEARKPKRLKTSVSEEVDDDNPSLVMNYLIPPGSFQFTVVEVERMDDDEITIKEEQIEADDEYDCSGNDHHDNGRLID